jgi:RNase P subunit RPR2
MKLQVAKRTSSGLLRRLICSLCGKKIKKGEQYYQLKGRSTNGSKAKVRYWCLDCYGSHSFPFTKEKKSLTCSAAPKPKTVKKVREIEPELVVNKLNGESRVFEEKNGKVFLISV